MFRFQPTAHSKMFRSKIKRITQLDEGKEKIRVIFLCPNHIIFYFVNSLENETNKNS